MKETKSTVKEKAVKSVFGDNGFDPFTSKKDIAKYYSQVIAEKGLADIHVNDNYLIGIKVPVWPSRYKGGELKYYIDQNVGKWKVSYKNGVLLKQSDRLLYNNIPDFKDLTYEDHDDHPFQFFVIACDNPKIQPGTIAHTRPESKSVNFFKFRGEELVMLNEMAVMFTEEV